MQSSLVLEFVLVMTGDDYDDITATLASLRHQTSSAWAARVVYNQDIDRESIESVTGKNPRIQFERISTLGTFSASQFAFVVFLPKGSVLDNDGVAFLIDVASTLSPSKVIAEGRPCDQLVMISQDLDHCHNSIFHVYQRSLFTSVRRRQEARPLIENIISFGSLQELVIEKTRQLDALEDALHRKDHDLLAIQRHLKGLIVANDGLSEANDGLNAANNDLNKINQELLNRLSNHGIRGLLRRIRN